MTDIEWDKWITEYICDWVRRMALTYGGIVKGEDGKTYDWGQALCREQYGDDPKDWPDIPSYLDLLRAKKWEGGEWPEWVLM
jgi:hypothetical protein